MCWEMKLYIKIKIIIAVCYLAISIMFFTKT
jgi:hypothetical protein